MLILDDVVDKTTQDKIENSIFSDKTQWLFARTLFRDDSNPEVNKKQRDTLTSFTKPMLNLDKQRVTDPHVLLYKGVIDSVGERLGKHSNIVYQIRAQLQLPLITEIDRKYGFPHIDGDKGFPYLVGVYYVNDCDGDTYIFKQTTNDIDPVNVVSGGFDVERTVEPKRGRFLLFDWRVYHAVGKPKTGVRCVLNYHFNLK